MKRKAAMLCMGACFAASPLVHAQSSVTLYGTIDEGVDYLNNLKGGRRYYLDAVSGTYGSKWAITGKEDLGDGWSAIFKLESGVNLNNGSISGGGTMFGREATVGIDNNRYGTVTLGRQYDIVHYYVEPLTVAGNGSAVFAHPGDIDNTAHSIRVNNAIRYMSKEYSGARFGAEYSVGGVSGNATENSGYSVGGSYAYGPLKVGAAFEYFKNPSSTAGSGLFTDTTNGANALSQSLNEGYVSATAYQVFAAGASYKIGAVTLNGSFSNVQYANLGGTLSGQTARFNDADFGITYFARPDYIFAVGYNYLVGKGVRTAGGTVVGDQHYNQFMAMVNYLVSKRTSFYLSAGYQRASGTSSIGTQAVADFTNSGDSSNNHQFIARAAIRHLF